MMRTRILLVGLAALALPACQSVAQYEATTHSVTMPDDTYRVFEHPKKDRIMTTPSMSAIIAVGPGGNDMVVRDKAKHEAAARKYLDDTGRANCPITSGTEIMKPQFEFMFSCPSGATG